MQIAPVATAYTEVSTTATTPITTPTGGRRGWRKNRAVRRLITGLPAQEKLLPLIAVVAAGLALAAPAHADPDTDFANELHTYGIYGQKDYNAWIGKITCKRLYNGTDLDADKSAKFVFVQLPKGSNTEQSWQFLGAALRTYCPDKMPVLAAAAR